MKLSLAVNMRLVYIYPYTAHPTKHKRVHNKTTNNFKHEAEPRHQTNKRYETFAMVSVHTDTRIVLNVQSISLSTCTRLLTIMCLVNRCSLRFCLLPLTVLPAST